MQTRINLGNLLTQNPRIACLYPDLFLLELTFLVKFGEKSGELEMGRGKCRLVPRETTQGIFGICLVSNNPVRHVHFSCILRKLLGIIHLFSTCSLTSFLFHFSLKRN